MTDKERFFAFMHGAGITPERLADAIEVGTAYEVNEDCGDKVQGFIGFVTVYRFDPDGNLIEMGAYE